MFTDFDYFIDSLDLDLIQRAINLPLSEEDRKIALGYVITKQLEGISMCFPKKNHATSYARLMIAQGIELTLISETLEITEKTLKKYKGEHGKGK